VHSLPESNPALPAITLPAQTLITGTDAEVFLALAGQAEAFRTGDGLLRQDSRFSAAETAEPPVPPAL